ncbi:MAG TPA: hypothetical protein DEO32_04375 [Ruminococcaceae bacterium]|nr:hypothetical protein [Oscillospiraceae bacterium]
MQKKTISVLLCLAMLLSMFAMMPANAVTTDTQPAAASVAAQPAGARTVESPDDFSWDNANVYFLLTDRFYNGNTSNDHSYGRTLDQSGRPISGWNTNPGTFHGGDFAGVTKKLEEGYFDKLGVNAIWISAPYEQIHGYVTPGDGFDFSHYSYHGYYVLDYTETDANFGTRQEFKTLVDTAHKHGVRVVMDIVMNHAGYNTIKDMIEFNFGSFKNKSAAESYLYKINGVNSLHDYIDYDNSPSTWGRWWGSSWVRSGLPGYSNDGGGDLTSCLAGLPDFRTESTNRVSVPTFLQEKWKKEGTYNTKMSKFGSSNTVSDYISSWLADWVETYGVDGFRCDTAKHVEMASWKKLKTKCSAALKKWRQNNPTAIGANWDEDFWMTGEAWGHGLGKSDYYNNGFDSMINFSFSGVGVPGVGGIGGTYQSYASQINNDENFNALTYISSHDSNLAKGKTDMFWQGSAFQLMPGAIQPYYGDESGRDYVKMNFDGDGGSGHSLRSDMNWNSMNTALLTHWQKVGTFRRNHVAVGAGRHANVSATSGYAFSRSYDDGVTSDGIIAVIGANKNASVEVNVSSMWGNGTTVKNAYDGTTAVVSNGKVKFNSGAQGTILIEGPQSTISMNIKGEYGFYNNETVSVSLRGADYAMVSVNGGTAFRVVNGQTFEIGQGIDVDTVFEVEMTATNSTETLKKSFSFKKKDPNKKTLVYFDNSAYNWGSTINAYIYDESGGSVKENAAWPGAAMTYDRSVGLYVIEVPDNLTNGNVIFSGGSSRYPGEMEKGLPIGEDNKILLGGNKWEPYNGQQGQPATQPDPSKSTTVYFDNSSSSFSTPTIYFWKKGESAGGVSWPGVPMERYKGNVYKYTFESKYNCCIFSNGNEQTKTGDLDIPGNNYIYNNGSWSAYSDAEVVTTPVTQPTVPIDGSDGEKVLIGDTNLDGVISIKDATLIQHFLVSMKKLTGAALFAANVNMDEVVNIKDATSIQYFLAAISSGKSHCGETVEYNSGSYVEPTQPVTQYVEPTQPVTQAPAKNYVYFKNTPSWQNVMVYFWSDDNLQMMAWPGTNTESVGDGVYRAEVPSGATWVIFNNGSGGNGNQTGDTKIEGYGKILIGESWSNYNG